MDELCAIRGEREQMGSALLDARVAEHRLGQRLAFLTLLPRFPIRRCAIHVSLPGLRPWVARVIAMA